MKRQEMKRLGGGGVPGWSVVKMGTQRAMASGFYVFAVIDAAFPLLPLSPSLWPFFLFWWFSVDEEGRRDTHPPQ